MVRPDRTSSSNNRFEDQASDIGGRRRERAYDYEGTSADPYATSSGRYQDDDTQYGWQGRARWSKDNLGMVRVAQPLLLPDEPALVVLSKSIVARVHKAISAPKVASWKMSAATYHAH
jgi:hypothetical protein